MELRVFTQDQLVGMEGVTDGDFTGLDHAPFLPANVPNFNLVRSLPFYERFLKFIFLMFLFRCYICRIPTDNWHFREDVLEKLH